MKILLDHGSPFFLAHGGVQIQIEQTKAALEEVGAEVEYLRWWDERQKGDILHFFGAPSVAYHHFTRKKKLPLVNTVLFSETCNRSTAKLVAQALVTRFLLAVPFGGTVKNQLSWKSFLLSRCNIVGLHAEARVLRMVYGVRSECIRVLPIGCEKDFLASEPSARNGDYLISVGTITQQKRTLELAESAIRAQVPILFVGKPYADTDPYWLRFKQLADSSPYVLHRAHTNDREELICLLKQARGFVLFSKFENWCMAADEAAAVGLPLLLPDQKWVRERFALNAYRLADGGRGNAQTLRRFFDDCPMLPPPPKPLSWDAVGKKLLNIYEEVLASVPIESSRK